MQIFKEMFHNIGLILALSILYSFVYRRFHQRTASYQIYSGLLFGIMATIGMLLPFHLLPGVIFDGRSILVSIAGLFGGPIPAIITALLTSVVRIHMGGSGALMGVFVTTFSAICGIAFFYIRKRRPDIMRARHLYLFGIIVHAGMLACTIALPAEIRMQVFRSIAMPVIIIFPIATVIICKLILDQEQQVTTRRELEKSEARYRGIVENLPVMICRFLPGNGVITFINEEFSRFFDVKREDLIGHSGLKFIPDEQRETILNLINSLNIHRPVITHEYQATKPDGHHWQQWIDQALFDESGRIVEYQSIGMDITAQKVAAERTKKSLKEKEILLKEIHHRVKNNMQVISSLLSLQSHHIRDEYDRSLFIDSQNRVRSMALVHEKLYRSDNLSEISFGDYIVDLSHEIKNSLTHVPDNIEIVINARNVLIGVDHAIPCALIINELLSNAIKYAFPDGRSGTITITMDKKEDGMHSLIVSDNGQGMPENLDFRNTKTLGLQIVISLTAQLNGTITLDSEGGTTFMLTF